MALVLLTFEYLTETRQRKIATGEIDSDKPCRDKVDELVELVGVRDTVDRGVDGEEEEKGVGNVAKAIEDRGLEMHIVRKIEDTLGGDNVEGRGHDLYHPSVVAENLLRSNPRNHPSTR